MMKYIPICLLLALFASCSTAYYGALEKVGFHKRDILVSRVKKARNSQIEAKETFTSALDDFMSVTSYSGGNLEKAYRRVDSAYTRSERKANEVKTRTKDVQNVTKALFKEWKKEINQYEDTELKRRSRIKYDTSQQRSKELLAAMKRAESRLDPVLRKFRDQTLFIKHNLNAQAVASLQGQVERTKIDVSRLIDDMNDAIQEANGFIKTLE